MRALGAALLLAASALALAQEEVPLDGEPIDLGALEERRLQGLEQATGGNSVWTHAMLYASISF